MLNHNEKELAKSVLNSKGWTIIEQIFLEEVSELKRVKTDGKRFEDIAIETIANDKYQKAINSFIRRVNSIKNEKSLNPVVYK